MSTSDSDLDILKASEYIVKLAKQRFNLELNYSTDSLENLDILIETTRQQFDQMAKIDKLNDKVIQRASLSLGGYLGEVIRRAFGGSWHAKNNILKVLVINSQEISPIHYIYDRLIKTNENAESVRDYFNRIGLISKSHLSNFPSSTTTTTTAKFDLINLAKNKSVFIFAIGAIILVGFVFILFVFGTPNFRTNLGKFIEEAEMLRVMTEQGVSYFEYRDQFLNVKTKYELIKDTSWPLINRGQKEHFDKAVYGWELILRVWDYKIQNPYSETLPKNSKFIYEVARYATPIFTNLTGEITDPSAENFTLGGWIQLCMSQASQDFEQGK